jgi:hypothetical protein
VDDVRSLLETAARAVDDATPPADLLRRGRRRARRQVTFAATAVVGLVAAVAVVVAPGTRPAPQTPAATPDSRTTAATVTGPPAAAWVRGAWTTGPAGPVHHDAHTATWTGAELLVIGGSTKGPPLANAAYDPARRTWRTLAAAPPAIGVGDGPQVWLGDRLFVFHGTLPPERRTVVPLVGALLYDPAADAWTATPRDPLLGATGLSATLVGSQVLVTGAVGKSLRAAFYDPATNAWQSADPPGVAGHDASFTEVVGTPAGALLWSLWSHSHLDTSPGSDGGGGSITSGVDLLRWDGAWTRQAWAPQTTVGRPRLVGTQVLLDDDGFWCGACPHPYVPGLPARLVDPETLAITHVPAGPLDESVPLRQRIGDVEVDLNTNLTGGQHDLHRGELSVLDVPTGRWTDASTAPGPLGSDIELAWTGKQLLAVALDGSLLTYTPGT